MNYEQLFLDNLPLIDRIVGHICRERSLRRPEFEDLASAVKLKLIENDYAVLRTFEGRSSLSTFLVVVVRRLYLDQFVHEHGRWRPSTTAKELGEAAVLLEQWMHRDGVDSQEAGRRLTEKYPHLDASAVDEIRSQLPQRRSRQQTDTFPTCSPPTAEEKLLASERGNLGRTAAAVLNKVFRTLPAEDRLIMKLRFEDGLKLSTIAIALHLDAKGLYRRVDRLMVRLRAALAAGGIGRDEVAELLSFEADGFDVTFRDPRVGDDDRTDPPFGREAVR
jgi:RNA polymerase sigma factor (sigma-70 family)